MRNLDQTINILIREGASGPRAREGPLEGPGGVIFPKQNVSDLFRGQKIPGTPDQGVEISLDLFENPPPFEFAVEFYFADVSSPGS